MNTDINKIKSILFKEDRPKKKKKTSDKREMQKEVKRRVAEELNNKNNADLLDLIAEMIHQTQKMKASNQKAIEILDRAISKDNIKEN